MTPLLHGALAFSAALVAATTLGLLLRYGNRRRGWCAFGDERRVQRWLVVAVFLAPILVAAFPSRHGETWRLPSKVWIAPSGTATETLPSRREKPGAIRPILIDSPVADFWAPAVLAIYAALALSIFLADVFRLGRFRRTLTVLRRQGRVTLAHAESVPDALSFRWGLCRYVVLGTAALEHRRHRRTAIHHEATHLRAGDTDFAWAHAVLGAFGWAFWPVHRWLSALAELEEFACDETVTTRGHGFARAYARDLLEVAETRVPAAGGGRPRLAAALGACGGGPLLVRRVEMMLGSTLPRRPERSWCFGAAVAAVVVGVAAFGRGTLVDGRVSRVRAEAAAARVLASDDFAIPVNAPVLRELNKLAGTPEGREHVRQVLERMEQYRPMVEEKMRAYGVPSALLAVPFVESAWQNLPKRPPVYGAGLWQFIKSTALNYGLRVDKTIDERVDDPVKATDAALRLLVANRLRFRSWALSLIAYNGGEGKLQEVIDRVGRDPWKAVEAGAESEKGYLAKVYAAALVLADPDLVP